MPHLEQSGLPSRNGSHTFRLCCRRRKMLSRRGNVLSFELPVYDGSECQKRERHVGLPVALRDCFPSVRVKPSSRLPCSCTWRGFAGRLAALEVSGAARSPSPRTSRPALLGMTVALGTSESPAVREARTLLGAGAGIGRSLPGPSFSVSPRSWRSWPQCWEEFDVDTGVATMEAENNEVLNSSRSRGRVFWRLGGDAQVQRVVRTRRECPGVITAAHWTRSARGLDDACGRVVELAALREGAPAPSLGSHDVPDLWSAPIRKKRQRTRLDMAVALVSLRGTVERLALETAKKQLTEYAGKGQNAGSTALSTTTTTCRSRFGTL